MDVRVGQGTAITQARYGWEHAESAMTQEKINPPKQKSDSIKNPEQELEHPAPMPRDQQGQGGKVKDTDPAGQQGGTH
jgi:hypothetical protein